MSDSKTHYATLGVPPGATHEEIWKAYRALALKHHPDKWTKPDAIARATKVFSGITEAWSVLGQPTRRVQYDLELRMTMLPCAHCKGTGQAWKQHGFAVRTWVPCPRCKGAGFINRPTQK